LQHFVDRLERDLPDKFDKKVLDLVAVIEEAKTKHGCDHKTLKRHGRHIFRTCVNPLSPFSSAEKDDEYAEKVLKSWLAHIEDVEFVEYFRGGRRADRGADTPFGKLKKHSSELLDAARDRIVTFRGKDEYKFFNEEALEKQVDELVNVFVCEKIATSRNAVDQMFRDRAALYSEMKSSRARKKGRGEKDVRSSLKRNTAKINQLIDFVDFWEWRHAKLHGWEHSKYDRGDMKRWMDGDELAVVFPSWKPLYKSHGDKDSGLISDAGGCGSTSLWYLAFQYIVLYHDVIRIREEVLLMEVEIQRMKIYYDRRIRLLEDEMIKAAADAKRAVPAFGKKQEVNPERINCEDATPVYDKLIALGVRHGLVETEGQGVSWPAFREAHRRIQDIERMLVEVQKRRAHCILNAHGTQLIEWGEKDWDGEQPVSNGKKPRKRTKKQEKGHVLFRQYFKC